MPQKSDSFPWSHVPIELMPALLKNTACSHVKCQRNHPKRSNKVFLSFRNILSITANSFGVDSVGSSMLARTSECMCSCCIWPFEMMFLFLHLYTKVMQRNWWNSQRLICMSCKEENDNSQETSGALQWPCTWDIFAALAIRWDEGWGNGCRC